MKSKSSKTKTKRKSRRRLLVLNCHEAWVYQLGALDFDLDIVVGLKGRHTATWDERMRPVPPRARLLTLQQALAVPTEYYCMVAHNISDLLDLKQRKGPRLLVIHSTLDGKYAEQGASADPDEVRRTLRTYVEMTNTHVVAVSELKGRSWGFLDDLVPFSVDVSAYPEPTYELAEGLRISNFFTQRRNILMGELHAAAFGRVPVRLVGHNPDLPGVEAAKDWQQLKDTLSKHRFYVHTADPALEDGYNMAALEAMAAGLPVLSNVHPSSPITDGVDGFVSNDPARLEQCALRLLDDAELARQMGTRARQTVAERFGVDKFRREFSASIERARAAYRAG